ncbi:cellulose-growth-specific protein [Choiromyces venosus 120613-1]|uniref:AA9 family lytic polysaccharide monooxygenase n=1 Tax=Choiromyces venosus 120613-1 TaxID=1336337 RepID=A0A3N4JXR8_9PEZI|nr:cellulose-growth-specific protein [Choiromyces venosus 120613-1]
MKFSILLSASALLGQAIAHGGVTTYILDGVTYPGFSPHNTPTGQTTIQRQWSTYDPLYSPSGSKLKCTAPYSTQWTHAEGPVMAMAKVGASFADPDGNGNVWLLIQSGLLSGIVRSGTWGLGTVLKTLQWTSKIPANLAPGNYLIRHELLALHQANTPQFYPECAQVNVIGSGTRTPAGSYLTSFPEAYKASGPGITIDIYSSTETTSTIPGPGLVKLPSFILSVATS